MQEIDGQQGSQAEWAKEFVRQLDVMFGDLGLEMDVELTLPEPEQPESLRDRIRNYWPW